MRASDKKIQKKYPEKLKLLMENYSGLIIYILKIY